MPEIDVTRLVIDVHPILVRIDPQEIEEYLPSFRANVQIEIQHSTGSFRYAGDLWFAGDLYPKFEQQLKGLVGGTIYEAKLADLSTYFWFTQRHPEQAMMLELSVSEPYTGSLAGETRLVYQDRVDRDFLIAVSDRLRRRATYGRG